MPESFTQASFNAGEWSPNLYTRVDMQKYRSAAALLSNFFVDYRGGASTRVGTKYVLQAYQPQNPVRLITFQASYSAGYVLEFGSYNSSSGYIRFYNNGQPIVETAFNITAATNANPCVLTITGNNYALNDWIYITGVAGMTQLNGRYFQVIGVSGASITLGTLSGANLNSATYGTYTSGGTAARVYTIDSPYSTADNLRLLKVAQSINQMVICHPNHPAYVLLLSSPTNWSLSTISTGATVAPPTSVTVTSTFSSGTAWYYSYVVTAIDSKGQESLPSTAGTFAANATLRITAGTNIISWAASAGAVAYNVYETTLSGFGAIPAGVGYGFIGTCQGTSFVDTNIAENFTESPPIPQSPFSGFPIASIAIGTAGSYAGGSTAPTISFSGGGVLVSAQVILQFGALSISLPGGGSNNQNWSIGDVIPLQYGIKITVTGLIGGLDHAISSATISSAGAFSGVTLPSSVNAIGGEGTLNGVGITTWSVVGTQISNGGAYATTPTAVISSGAATATPTLGAGNGNPTVPGFVQQRLVLAGLINYPATFYMSQPGQYFNFNISNPVQANNAIQGTLVSGALNTIKSIVGSAAGMIIMTDKASWLVNGGSSGSAITPFAIVANPQSFVGANDVPPIVANYDILYVQAKGSAIRDLAFNIYFSVFTGNDISTQSSHLFYGYTIQEWAWAEQPYYLVQAIRSDGTMLSLTYIKEQDFIAWSHYTTAGSFQSVSSVTEVLSTGAIVDAVYTVVSRVVGGVTVQYIERFAERSLSAGASAAWTVDAGLQYTGAGALSFIGAEQLAGLTVTGLATDNLGNTSVITPFTMPATGFFTLPSPPAVGATNYTTVTIGLGYTCQFQTLPLEIGEPSIQGKVKKIQAVDIRVKDTLGLQIGSSFSTVVNMKDLILGNVSSALTGQPNQIVTGLVTGDAKTILDPTYTVPGQYCIQQTLPWPATILGAFPQFVTEDRR